MQHKQIVKGQHRKARAKKYAGGWTVYLPHRTLGIGDSAKAAWRDAANKLAAGSRTSLRARIDQIIDWHERNKTKCPQIRVQATPNTVRKFARKKRGQYRYRNHIIVPIRLTRTRAEIAAANQRGSSIAII